MVAYSVRIYIFSYIYNMIYIIYNIYNAHNMLEEQNFSWGRLDWGSPGVKRSEDAQTRDSRTGFERIVL